MDYGYNPQPASAEERTLAMVMWIISIFSSLLGPLIFLLLSRDKRFVYAAAAQALVFHAALAIAIIVGTVVTLGLGAIILAPLGAVLGIGVPIVAALSCNQGRFFDVPVTGPLARKWFSS